MNLMRFMPFQCCFFIFAVEVMLLTIRISNCKFASKPLSLSNDYCWLFASINHRLTVVLCVSFW